MKRFLSHLFLLVLPALTVAHEVPTAYNKLETTKIITNEDFTCSLPAPTGMSATASALGTVGVNWAPVSGAVDYRVQVYEVTSGNLVGTHYTTNTYLNVTPGAPQCYSFHVSAGCGSGAYSNNEAVDEACPEWVTDIVINGYQNCSGGTIVIGNATLNSTNSSFAVPFSPGTRYKATIAQSGNTNYNRVIDFGFIQPNTVNVLKFSQSSGMLGTLVTDATNICANQGVTPTMFLSQCGQTITRLLSMQVTTAGNQPLLTFSNLEGSNTAYNITVESVTCSGKERDEALEETQENDVWVAPNPFSGAINILRSTSSDLTENAHLQLYDLTGKIYFDQDFTGQDQLMLSSGDLPSGIYILRTRVGDKVQTQKIIKND